MFEDFLLSYANKRISLLASPEELQKIGYVPLSLHKMICCGLREVYTTPWTTSFSKDSFLSWMEYSLVGEGNHDWFVSAPPKKPRTGMLLLALNSKEAAHRDKQTRKEQGEKRIWAKAVGFKRLSSVINHVHGGNKLILFGFQVPEDLSPWKWKGKALMDEAVEKFKEEEEKEKEGIGF